MRFALNPMQWLATADGRLDSSRALPLPQLLTTIADLGFTALTVAPPADMSVAAYRDALRAQGISPAPGYLGAPLEDAAQRDDTLSRARTLAQQHQELGLTELFVASSMASPRIARPAVGADRDPQRLAHIAQTLREIGTETRRYGVTACLHQHVGTWIEAEDELEWLLANLDAEIVALGPDTGHMAWADIDPVAFLARHHARVKALHVKDIHLDVAARHRASGSDYRAVVADGVWAEPGYGDLSFAAILDALGHDFAGWAIVEVDKPSLPSAEESVRACAAWTRTVT